jgi:hypothetical protein
MSTFKTTIERHVRGIDAEVDIVVEYNAWQATPGKQDGPGGPKLEPDEPAGIEIELATEKDTGVELVLTASQEDDIKRQIGEYLDEYENADRDDLDD